MESVGWNDHVRSVEAELVAVTSAVACVQRPVEMGAPWFGQRSQWDGALLALLRGHACGMLGEAGLRGRQRKRFDLGLRSC